MQYKKNFVDGLENGFSGGLSRAVAPETSHTRTANTTEQLHLGGSFSDILGGVKKYVRGLGKVTAERKLMQGPMYRGPTRANRNNNPLNIKASPYTQSYRGVSGLDPKPADDGGQFLIFRTLEDGFNAAKRLIRTEGYVGLSVDQALKRWSGGGYGGEIAPSLRRKIIGKMSDREISSLIQTMAKHEGFQYGHQGGELSKTNRQGYKGFHGKTSSAPRRTHLGVVTTQPGTSTKYEKTHPGIDIANKKGTKIPSFTNGIVVAVQRGQSQGSNGYGNYVIVKDKDGNKHRYSHLNRGYVRVGQKISKGQAIGEMGNTGKVYSPSGKGDGTHLDYRVVNAYGKYMNPLTYVKNLG
jgi:hypothetical protein